MNLFQISNELRALYDALEENGGELTPEIEEDLAITEQDFLNKIDGYVSLIRMMEADVSLCDTELKRIASVKESKKKSIERLKNIVINATLEFGDTNKTGNKTIDFGTFKVSTRKTKVCEVNDDEVQNISNHVYEFIKGLNYNNLINENDNTEDAIKFINEDAAVPVGREDLSNIQYSFIFTGNLNDLLDGSRCNILKELFTSTVTTEYKVNKNNCKKSMENGSVLTFANLNENQSLIIK